MFSQTTIPAGNVSGTWTKAGSPYKILGEITVAKGNTLTLEPGTVLEFQDNYALKVDGILNSQGKKGDSILFKAAQNKTWSGIHYINNTQIDTIRFNYCRFENTNFGFKYGYSNYSITIRYSSPIIIKNSAFNYLYQDDKQSGSIYCRKNVILLDSISLNSKATKIVAIGSIFLDSSYWFKIRNVSTYFPINTNKNGPDIHISQFKGNIGEINNFKNLINSSIKFGIFNSNNVKVDNMILQDKVNFLLGNSRNCKIQNSKFINSNKNVTIETIENCSGSIFDNCEVNNCGSYLRDSQWGMRYMAMDIQSSGPLFKNCNIINNKQGIMISQQYGAGTPMFLNCNISGNLYYPLFIEGFPVFVNCNFQKNQTFYTHPQDTTKIRPYSGCIVVSSESYPSRPYFYNCLMWGNKDSVGHHNSIVLYSNNSNVKSNIHHCLIQGDTTSGVVGFDDNTNKRFYINPSNLTYSKSSGKSPGFIDSANGNFNLINNCNQRGYAINRGMSGNLLTQYPYNTLLSQYGINIYNTTDLNGNQRITDDTIDIGCYESSGTKKSLKLLTNYNDTSMCYGASKTYASKTAGTVQTYQWQQKQGSTISTVSSQSMLSLNKQKTSGIQYRLKVINNECLPLQDSSRWFNVTINNPLKKGYSRIPNKDTIFQSDTMTLSTNSGGYKSILWSNGSISPTIKFKGANLGPIGKYQFTIEAETNTGCIETDTLYIHTKKDGTFISNITNSTTIKLYPNPTQDEISIEGKELAKIQVFNTHGQLIIENNTQEDIITISTKQLPSGIYFLKAIDKQNKESVVRLLVK